MTGIEKGKTVYHVINPMREPEKGKVVYITPYNTTRKAGRLITIKTESLRIITDYESNFTLSYHAICNYWK